MVVFNFDGYNLYLEFRNKVINVLYLGGEFFISSVLRVVGILFFEVEGLYFWVVIVVIFWWLKSIWDIRILEVVVCFLLNCGVWLYVLFIGENFYVGWLCLMIMELSDVFLVVLYCDLFVNIGFVVRYIISDNCEYIYIG